MSQGPIRRTLHEWGRIGHGDGVDEIPVALADRLAAVARGSAFAGRGGDGVLEHGRHGLRARGVVGILTAPGAQLEILPRIEAGPAEAVSDAGLRQRLIHLLAIAHDLPLETADGAQLGVQRTTVLDVLIQLFCTRLADALRHGLPRQYREQAEDLPVLRGRLDVTRQVTTHAVTPWRVACRHDELSADIALNQVMRAALQRLSGLAVAPGSQRRLRDLGFAYTGVSEISPAALRGVRIVLDRSNRRWQDLLAMARLFLAGIYQHSSSGRTDGHALLFEMNALFEACVHRLLLRALIGTDLRLVAQGGKRPCLFDGEIGFFRTRPDLILWQGGRAVLIIDTKWKRLKPLSDDPARGISQADVYQMMAYARLYDCPRVLLLYPHHSGLPPAPAAHRYAIAAAGAVEALHLATLDPSRPVPAQIAALRHLVQEALQD